MNERIREFELEAIAYADSKVPSNDRYNDIYHSIVRGKFAELIVEKFDDILVLELVDCIGNQDKQAEQRIERLRERVKTYFGVEE